MSVAALWLKHRPLARKVASGWYLPGYEPQDVLQEAEIALWLAARDYRDDQGTAFTTFANLVVRRHLMTCLKLATRQKHLPLNDSLRTQIDEDGEPRQIAERLPCLHQVSDRVEDREQLRAVLHAINNDLTPWQRHCVIGVATGASYHEIGSPKAVDNALTKARAKLRDAGMTLLAAHPTLTGDTG